MCGRVASFTPLESIARLVNARGPFPPWKPRYNRPPGEPIENVVEANGIRRIEPYLWGLVSSDKKHMYINVKAEGLTARRAFEDRRSLIFVDGFYEWDKRRQPYYIQAKSGEPVALGAVYDRSPEQVRCAVITTPPNPLIAQVHNRMPLIVPPQGWRAWLDPLYPDRAELEGMLRPYSSELLEIHPVSKMVNSPKNDRPELLDPAGDMPRVVELKQKIRALLEPRNEMTAIEIAQALSASEEEMHSALRSMTAEVDERRAHFYLTKWKR